MAKGAKLSSWPLPQCSYKRRINKLIKIRLTEEGTIVNITIYRTLRGLYVRDSKITL